LSVESSVVTLDAVVAVLVGAVKRIWDQLFDHRLECLCEIGDDFLWLAVRGQGCGEERR
jgi:hypothetical protein